MNEFEPQPRLVGELVELRPLVASDWEGLYQVASDPLVWEQHPARDRYEAEVFREFFRGALESGGALVILDRRTRKIIGSSRYHDFDPQAREVEIGWTFLARAYWGGRYNGEVKRLMLNHSFRFVDSVIFSVGTTNIRSQKAMQKIGGILTDRRVQRSLNGQAFDHVVFQIKKPAPTA